MNSFTSRWLPAVTLGVLFCLICVSTGRADVQWRMSVKLILDASGNRPASGPLSTPTKIRDEVEQSNAFLLGMGRGVSFDLVEVIELSGVAEHFNVPIDTVNLLSLEAAAKLNPSRFRWRTDAINVYINGSTSGAGGICSFPYTGADSILIGQASPKQTILHECGHFFGLCHTHGCTAGGCESTSDNISDTLVDASCWNRDDIAFANFFPPFPYAALSAENQRKVDDAFGNIMSYHQEYVYYLSPLQLDVMADNSNGPRNNVATGRIRFVDHSTPCALQDGSPSCNGLDLNGPFDTLKKAVDAATPGDLVLAAAGSYRTVTLFSKRLVLRSWHGNVEIRAP